MIQNFNFICPTEWVTQSWLLKQLMAKGLTYSTDLQLHLSSHSILLYLGSQRYWFQMLSLFKLCLQMIQKLIFSLQIGSCVKIITFRLRDVLLYLFQDRSFRLSFTTNFVDHDLTTRSTDVNSLICLKFIIMIENYLLLLWAASVSSFLMSNLCLEVKMNQGGQRHGLDLISFFSL